MAGAPEQILREYLPFGRLLRFQCVRARGRVPISHSFGVRHREAVLQFNSQWIRVRLDLSLKPRGFLEAVVSRFRNFAFLRHV